MLRVENLDVFYGDVQALNGVSLEIEQGAIAAIPRSSNAARIAQNIDVFDFALSDDDMRRIGALKRADGRIANPIGRAPEWDL